MQHIKPSLFGLNYSNRDFTNKNAWGKMKKTIDKICLDNLDKQEPLIMQPIWKTNGKTPQLSTDCLDLFVWSNLAFIQLFSKEIVEDFELTRITRQTRTLIWLFRMLYDFSKNGQFDHKKIIDELSYNTKNDKAFAVSGNITHQFMACEELTKPRITSN